MKSSLWYALCYVNVTIAALEVWATKIETWLALVGGPPGT